MSRGIRARVKKETLKRRLDSLLKLLIETQGYPIRARILAYTPLEIKNKNEHMGRVRELADILNVTVKFDDDEIKKLELQEYVDS